MVDLGAALKQPSEDLSLFRTRLDYAGRLRSCRVREHVLVGDVTGSVGDVPTVWHGSMNFVDRLPMLEPDLVLEAELMARRIDAMSKSDR